MKPPLCVRKASVALGLAGALLLGLAPGKVQANVYATDLRFSAPAVDASLGGTVTLNFRLNEPADQQVRVDIYQSGTDLLVRTANLGPLPRGLNSYVWDLKNDSAVLVTTNVEYYFKVYTQATGYGSWTQISNDNDTAGWFEFPQNLTVNTNPASPYFGRAYVIQGRDGTPAGGSAMLKGLYQLNADITSVGVGPYNGNQTWFASFSSISGAASPFKLKVGPEDKVYISDWSDSRGGVMVAPPDLSGTFQQLLNPNIIADTNGQSVDAAITQHGSVSDMIITGKGLNRKLYTIDEDLRTTADVGVGKTNGSIWRYDIGPLDQVYPNLATPFWIDGNGPSNPNRVINFACGLARDAEGNFYIAQNRSNGTDAPCLIKVGSDGADVPLWQSILNWGNPDPLKGSRGTGIAVDDARSRVAFSAAEQGVIYVFNKDLSITSLTQVGGGAIAWTVGANSAASFASNALTGSFTANTPPAGIQINDIGADSSSATVGTINGWAVGNAGNILKVTARQTYELDGAGVTSDNLNSVAVIRGTGPQAWAVGDNGTIVKNLSGAWEIDGNPVSTKLNGVALRATSYAAYPAYDAYAVGDSGTILQRLDASNTSTPTTWTTQSSGTSENLNDISVLIFANSVATTKGYAVGNNGTILKTLDGGATWTALTSGTTTNLRGVSAVTATTAWAVGDGGLVLRTTDGTTWTTLTSGTLANLKSVFFKDTQNGWAAGDGGVVIRTRNGGNTWSVMTSATTQNLNSVFAIGVGSGAPRGIAFDAVGNLYESNNSSERIRVYSPPDGPNNYTTTSPYKFVPTNGDPTKPGTPVVTAPPVTADATKLDASWTSSSAVSYQYAVGVTAEDQGDYVINWTNTSNTSVNLTNLSLINGVKYFFYVRGKSANGVWSDVGVSAGTLVNQPVVIGTAKTKPDGEQVTLQNVVVTMSSSSEFVVQEQDRSSGIVVVSTANPVVGKLITVTGTMGTVGPERVVNAAPADVSAPQGDFTAIPLQTRNSVVDGSIATGGSGLPDYGLLVQVSGIVTAWDAINSAIYVDDGTNVANDTPIGTVVDPVLGIKVLTTAIPGSIGDFANVIGIARAVNAGQNVIRRVDTRSDLDVTFNP